jgi:hypothetical protein
MSDHAAAIHCTIYSEKMARNNHHFETRNGSLDQLELL